MKSDHLIRVVGKIDGWQTTEQTWRIVLLGDVVAWKVRIELVLFASTGLGWKYGHEKRDERSKYEME